ncbi:MAG: DUF7133 domain-containing protein, partial [Planctomycetota bacterium]
LALPQSAPTEADYYPVQTIPIPEGIELEVGGLQPMGEGVVLVCTRRGEIWRISEAFGPEPQFGLWADGLQEPLGLWLQDGWLYTATRGELMRIRDRDGDGRADDFETVHDDWDISGNYHEYNFGPRPDADGNLWITTNRAFGEESFGHKPWRGWALRLKEGEPMEPLVGGLRSPAGLERSPWGDLFYTDNQGEWVGASKLSILKPGDFHGHPFGMESAKLPASGMEYPGELTDGILFPEALEAFPDLRLPAVWFPYDKMGRSPSGMAWDERGAFGPFTGQLFVGDQYQASVLRVTLEQVDGEWQGACYPFRKGLAAGVIRVRQAGSGGLWLGMSDRGWPSLGAEGYGLQMLTWNGEVPFEIRTMQAASSGFVLTFTRPVDAARFAEDPPVFQIESYTYSWHSAYGSEEMDRLSLEVGPATLSSDGMKVELPVEGLREGYVHELRVDGLVDGSGHGLLHPEAYYTLIRIPAGSGSAHGDTR